METIIAGDTFGKTFSFSDYPASEYDLSIALRGAAAIDIEDGDTGVTIEADGDSFSVTVTAAVTAAWTAGDYWYAVYASKSAERYVAEQGTVVIAADLSAVSTVYDGRTWAAKTLDLVETALQGRATKDQLSYSISGRQINKIPIPDLIKLRDKLRNEVQSEKRAERIANGLAPGNKIKVRL